MAENKNGYGALIAAFIAGGLTGAALAICLAPAAGEEARDKIGDLLETLKEKTEAPPAVDAPRLTASSEHRNRLAEGIRRRKEQLFGKPF